MKILEKLKKLFPYELVFIVVFFGAPAVFLGGTTPEEAASVLTVSLLEANPMASLLMGFVFGTRHGFCWGFPLMTAALFLLTCLFFFDLSGALFALFYGVCGAVGCVLGKYVKKMLDA